jgi:hypothetical protein
LCRVIRLELAKIYRERFAEDAAREGAAGGGVDMVARFGPMGEAAPVAAGAEADPCENPEMDPTVVSLLLIGYIYLPHSSFRAPKGQKIDLKRLRGLLKKSLGTFCIWEPLEMSLAASDEVPGNL